MPIVRAETSERRRRLLLRVMGRLALLQIDSVRRCAGGWKMPTIKPGAAWSAGDLHPRIEETYVSEQLLAELLGMAGWMGLDRVEVGDPGDLAPCLRSALEVAVG